ncbi:hypothetical protein [Xanthobacter aminoxidans]|uniref:hypothetical protein n=1 Tax=Xanthobacter aminoxidans TaxID=186280 RepID=UPI002022DDC0|nr:hypothetical protein [Xanthobacter aminoxidans]MCL8385526.1 hypothetical protein [Xanthobacter aminoxidans]
MTDIWMQTGTGRAFDLLAPTADMVDLEHDVAEALAREPRFGGHVRSGPYSVAQHCVLGVDAIIAETGSIDTARAFLLHDGHESYCKDITTPLAAALDRRVEQVIAERWGMPPEFGRGVFDEALRGLKSDINIAIHAAAGHPWPLPPDIAARVHHWDLAMLTAERRDMLCKPPKPWHPSVERVPPPARLGRIKVWPWPKAADEWRARLHTLFPHLAAKAA